MRRQRRRVILAIAVAVAVAVSAVIGLAAWLVMGSVRIPWGDEDLAVPLPSPHVRIDSRPGCATYLVLGNYDVARFYRNRDAEHGWRYVDQAGGTIILTRGPLRLDVSFQARYSVYVLEIELCLGP